MFRISLRLLIAHALASLAVAVHAHSGALDATGCHNQKGVGHHCHGGGSVPARSSSPPSIGDDPSKRSSAARGQFTRSHPCPSTGRTEGQCPGYHVDHVVPLACGGSDLPGNMQWLSAEANLRKGSMGCRR